MSTLAPTLAVLRSNLRITVVVEARTEQSVTIEALLNGDNYRRVTLTTAKFEELYMTIEERDALRDAAIRREAVEKEMAMARGDALVAEEGLLDVAFECWCRATIRSTAETAFWKWQYDHGFEGMVEGLQRYGLTLAQAERKVASLRAQEKAKTNKENDDGCCAQYVMDSIDTLSKTGCWVTPMTIDEVRPSAEVGHRGQAAPKLVPRSYELLELAPKK
jgi:hypothetical protein